MALADLAGTWHGKGFNLIARPDKVGRKVAFPEYDLSNTNGLPRPVTPKASDFVGIEVGLTMYHDIDEKTNIYLDDLAFGNQRVGCNP